MSLFSSVGDVFGHLRHAFEATAANAANTVEDAAANAGSAVKHLLQGDLTDAAGDVFHVAIDVAGGPEGILAGAALQAALAEGANKGHNGLGLGLAHAPGQPPAFGCADNSSNR